MGKLGFLCFLMLLFKILAKPVDVEAAQDHLMLDDDYDQAILDSMYADGNTTVVSVLDFGAVGDGIADDTKAFLDAWKQACSTSNSVLLVPAPNHYLVSATRFKGPCAGILTVQIDGAIVAPGEPKGWDHNNPRVWLGFYNISKTNLQGSGFIDGSGAKWWAASCKRNKTNKCKPAPTNRFKRWQRIREEARLVFDTISLKQYSTSTGRLFSKIQRVSSNYVARRTESCLRDFIGEPRILEKKRKKRLQNAGVVFDVQIGPTFVYLTRAHKFGVRGQVVHPCA